MLLLINCRVLVSLVDGAPRDMLGQNTTAQQVGCDMRATSQHTRIDHTGLRTEMRLSLYARRCVL